MRKIRTNIKIIDDQLGGGLPDGFNVVLRGPPGTGKSFFVHYLMYNMLKQGYYCIIVTTDRTPEIVLEDGDESGWEYTKHWKEGKLIIIDAYSWKAGHESRWKYSINNLGELVELSNMIRQIKKKIPGDDIIEVFDVFSEFFTHVDEKSVLNFAERVCARARESQSICLFVIETGVQSDRSVLAMEAFTQSTIVFNKRNSRKYIDIEKAEATTYEEKETPFQIVKENGVVVMK